MAKLSAKVVNPISIKITTNHVTISCEDSNKEYELKDKIKIEKEHYGFTLINCIDDIEYEETYPTQGKIKKVELNRGMLNIYEFGKHTPWEFNNNGEIIQNPTIDSIYRIEIDYPTNSDRELFHVYVKKIKSTTSK